MTVSTRAYASQSATAPLAPLTIERREAAATDVAIDTPKRLSWTRLTCSACRTIWIRRPWPRRCVRASRPTRRSLAGSYIGGIAETQQMLDFCGEHNIVCDIEMIRMDKINAAYERLLKGDVKYRFVIDMASLRGAAL